MPLIQPVATELVDNGIGWRFEVRVYRDDDAFVPGRPPVVFIPGYAMNTFILGFHPGGPSMVEYLVQDGFEVWTANLRGQGGTLRPPGAGTFGMAELALDDLPVVFDHVRRHTHTGESELVPVGCSLGASLLYAYLAHHPDDHGFAAAVAIGGPLRWTTVHPLLKVAFTSGRLAGALPFRGTRRLAKVALPVLTRVPQLLSIYMNAEGIDLSAADQLVNTVEDPVPYINRQVARWVKHRDLVLRGVNTTRGLEAVEGLRLLAVLANRDGIVTPEAARSVVDALGDDAVDVLEVGTPEHWYAHADLFVGNRAQDEVFEPLRAWLASV